MGAIVCSTQLNGMRSIRQMRRTNEISLAIARKRWNGQRKRTPQKANAHMYERRENNGLKSLLVCFECVPSALTAAIRMHHCHFHIATTALLLPLLPILFGTACTWCSLNVKNGQIFVICKMKLFDFCFYFRNRVRTVLHTPWIDGSSLAGWLARSICLRCKNRWANGQVNEARDRSFEFHPSHIYLIISLSFSHSHFVIHRIQTDWDTWF